MRFHPIIVTGPDNTVNHKIITVNIRLHDCIGSTPVDRNYHSIFTSLLDSLFDNFYSRSIIIGMESLFAERQVFGRLVDVAGPVGHGFRAKMNKEVRTVRVNAGSRKHQVIRPASAEHFTKIASQISDIYSNVNADLRQVSFNAGYRILASTGSQYPGLKAARVTCGSQQLFGFSRVIGSGIIPLDISGEFLGANWLRGSYLP